jgi:hypothetical protein
MIRRRALWSFVALCAIGMSGCTQEDADSFFFFIVLFCFGVVASLGSCAGAALALVQAAQRRPRGYVNLAIAVPCSVAAFALNAFATNYFRGGSYGVDRDVFWLVFMTATPLCWLGATVIGIGLRPPAMLVQPPPAEYAYRGVLVQPPQSAPPVTPLRVVATVLPVLLVLIGYFTMLYLVLPVHVPAVSPLPQ